MTNTELHSDTKAILLLCGHFGGNDRDVQPLSLSEYNTFARRLRSEGLRPEDVLSSEGEERLSGYADGKVNPQRLQTLLERGMELAFAVEEWSRRGLWVVSRGDDAYPRLRPRMNRRQRSR